MIQAPTYILTADELGRLTGQTTKAVLTAFQADDLCKMAGGKMGIPPELVRADLAQKGIDYSCKVIAHINLKGGTGKTTSTITAATRAVQYGFKVCILDMDSQASATVAFDSLPGEDDSIFCDIWQHPAEMLTGALRMITESLYILPSSLDNSLLDLNLIHPAAQKNAVRGVCAELKKQEFDLVMIDCPPSLSAAVISTICAADIVVVPVCADIFSRKGLELTLNEIAAMCETFHITPPEIKILYTKFDRRINMSIDTYRLLKDMYADNFIPVPIRISTEFSKALEQHVTVFASSRQSQAKEDYDMYVRHLLGLPEGGK